METYCYWSLVAVRRASVSVHHLQTEGTSLETLQALVDEGPSGIEPAMVSLRAY